MLFKSPHRLMICEGTKTETRRPGIPVAEMGKSTQTAAPTQSRPAVPGKVRGFYTRPAFAIPRGWPFCRAEIVSCEAEALGTISEAGALGEGYPSVIDYGRVWDEIWGSGAYWRWRRDPVWVVKFRLLVQLSCAGCGESGEPAGLFPARGRHALFCRTCCERIHETHTA